MKTRLFIYLFIVLAGLILNSCKKEDSTAIKEQPVIKQVTTVSNEIVMPVNAVPVLEAIQTIADNPNLVLNKTHVLHWMNQVLKIRTETAVTSVGIRPGTDGTLMVASYDKKGNSLVVWQVPCDIGLCPPCCDSAMPKKKV